MHYDKTILYWISPNVDTQEKFDRLKAMLSENIGDDDPDFENKNKRRKFAIHYLAGHVASLRKQAKIENKLNAAGQREDGDLTYISTKSASAAIKTALSNSTAKTRLYIIGHGAKDKIENLDAVALVKHLRNNGLKAVKRIIILACGYDGSHASLAANTCQLLGLKPEGGAKAFAIPVNEYNWEPIRCEVAGFDSTIFVHRDGRTMTKKGDEIVELRVDSKKRNAGGTQKRHYQISTQQRTTLAKTIYTWQGEMVVTSKQAFV